MFFALSLALQNLLRSHGAGTTVPLTADNAVYTADNAVCTADQTII